MRDRLRAVFCDHLSIMRGKYLPASKLADSETRFCRSTFGVHYDKDLLNAPGAMMMQGLPDMELRWKHDDIRDSWDPHTKIVLGDLYDDEGAPLELLPARHPETRRCQMGGPWPHPQGWHRARSFRHASRRRRQPAPL